MPPAPADTGRERGLKSARTQQAERPTMPNRSRVPSNTDEPEEAAVRDTASKEHMPDEDRLRELLVGRKITEARITDERPDSYEQGPTGYLTLSDGTILKVWGNDGGCACSAGCYPLAELNEVDNIITNVQVEERPDHDWPGVECRTCGEKSCWKDGHDNQGYYRIFVFAENRRINVASFEGSDGNGYYGTGWWLTVEREPSDA